KRGALSHYQAPGLGLRDVETSGNRLNGLIRRAAAHYHLRQLSIDLTNERFFVGPDAVAERLRVQGPGPGEDLANLVPGQPVERPPDPYASLNLIGGTVIARFIKLAQGLVKGLRLRPVQGLCLLLEVQL